LFAPIGNADEVSNSSKRPERSVPWRRRGGTGGERKEKGEAEGEEKETRRKRRRKSEVGEEGKLGGVVSAKYDARRERRERESEKLAPSGAPLTGFGKGSLHRGADVHKSRSPCAKNRDGVCVGLLHAKGCCWGLDTYFL
jgi:hypothetical protein